MFAPGEILTESVPTAPETTVRDALEPVATSLALDQSEPDTPSFLMTLLRALGAIHS